MKHGYYLKSDILLKSILTAVVILAIITGTGLINQGVLGQVQQQVYNAHKFTDEVERKRVAS
jgi:hypothetical protein